MKVAKLNRMKLIIVFILFLYSINTIGQTYDNNKVIKFAKLAFDKFCNQDTNWIINNYVDSITYFNHNYKEVLDNSKNYIGDSAIKAYQLKLYKEIYASLEGARIIRRKQFLKNVLKVFDVKENPKDSKLLKFYVTKSEYNYPAVDCKIIFISNLQQKLELTIPQIIIGVDGNFKFASNKIKCQLFVE